MLGQNVKLNSGGNNTILDSAHRTAGILLDARNHGSIVFLTGGANAVGEKLKIDDDGRVLVGPGAIATPKCGHAGIDIPNNDWAIIMGGSDGNGNRANNANKDGRFAGAHYVNAEEPVGIIRCTSGASANELHMGGGTSLVNAATQISLYTAANTTTTGGTERVRISSAGDATFKYKVTIGDSYAGGEILSLGKSSGTSYMAFHNGGANMGFIGYASELISGGGSNELGIRSQDDISFATGGNSETLRLTTAGYAYFGGYPTTHTVAGGSPVKVRSGAGAWGISLGTRYSQNDYAYIGFTDMNGTENLADINVNRTGPNTGRMHFSTNNGSGSLQRVRIESTGEVVISDDGTFRDQRMPLVITGQGFGHGQTQQGTTQDAIYMTAGASGNYSTLTLTVDKSSWGSVAYEIHAAAYNGRHLHRIGGFYQNGNSITGDHGTTTASSGSSFSISAPASQQFTMTISGNTWTHPSAWVRLVLSGNGFLRSDLISFAWS